MNAHPNTKEPQAVGNRRLATAPPPPPPSGPASGSASFDGIHRDAVDRTAALMFARGVKYENQARIGAFHWESPPPMRKVPPHGKGVVDLTGRKVGRLVVLGLHKTIMKTWVVRCACGDYETRRAKAIQNPENRGDRCRKCRNVAAQRVNSEFHRTGRRIDARDL